ncbi:hypothetical protein [Nocardiopsis sp. FIRDI 009]|uniref:hypothetical protein n=1 Tax=Nocardiopsis sp. FIRDI 009 TaxID=714197 RepID=UPI000E26D575|nr:hypothetical protein [Nocardiopsis sp. FIRDI 009]
MSSKKRRRRKPHRAAPRSTSATAPGPTPRERTVSRTPLVMDDPPDRRVTALWVVLTLLWLLGTPLALLNLVLVVTDAQEAALAGPDPTTGGPPAQVVTDVGNGLVWVLVMALVVPAASAVAALFLRRRIAAIGFTAALVVSAVPLLVIMPPADLWRALVTHFTS